MKKITLAIILVLLGSVLFAETYTHTVFLIAKVERAYPEFTLVSDRNTIGTEQAFHAFGMKSGYVSAAFRIVQTNDSNLTCSVRFEVQATALGNGASQSRAAIVSTASDNDLDERPSVLSFTREMTKAIAGSAVADVIVTWDMEGTSPDLVYDAFITLKTTVN